MGTKQNSKNEEFLSSGRCRANPSVPVPVLIPAAQYVRKSTNLQQYSLTNQIGAIKQYAEKKGFNIIRTYTDAGRSGVVLKQRTGLKALLQDVVGGRIDYKAILVYDVSRWGRFQDADESAHYEFICKDSGVPVHYCAETFSNDGTLPSMLMKMMKRTMAGEYSRELGVKVFDGKKRLALLGYRVGGACGYGLRRMMISADGKRKLRLEAGEYKSLITDRVILIPGPKSEVRCVRKIYSMTLDDGLSITEIVDYLNRANIAYLGGRPWSRNSVRKILTDVKYAGVNTWNLTSKRLHTPLVQVPIEQWAVKAAAFSPLVDRHTFDRVQVLLKKKQEKVSNDQLLLRLRRLLSAKGRISQTLIARTKNIASLGIYYRRFGSFLRIYELLGYRPPAEVVLRAKEGSRLRELRRKFMAEIVGRYPDNITMFRQFRRTRSILRLDNSLVVSVLICRTLKLPQGIRWAFSPVLSECNNVTLLCRLKPGNEDFHSFYVFRKIDKLNHCTLQKNDPWLKEGKRLTSLSQFYEVAKRFEAD